MFSFYSFSSGTVFLCLGWCVDIIVIIITIILPAISYSDPRHRVQYPNFQTFGSFVYYISSSAPLRDRRRRVLCVFGFLVVVVSSSSLSAASASSSYT
mmetsp:Transcript_1306/g.2033  ORF Transcript_1306/g.2033 Transcript_1306/m.2033 type:complete len:98 (-) Transcript_1306:188-481(-)